MRAQDRGPRVALVITRAHHGGAQTHVAEIMHSLGQHGALTLVAGEEGPLTQTARDMRVPVYVLEHLKHDFSLRAEPAAVRALRKTFAEIQPTVVHSHTSKAGMLARLCTWSTPVIHTSHGWHFQRGAAPGTRIRSWMLETALARRAASLVCVCEHDLRLLRQLPGRHRRARCIYPGLRDVPPATPHDRRDDRQLRILCVARFVPQKDQPTVLRAIQALGSDAGRVHVTFVGDGPTRSACERLAHSLGVAAQTQFVGTRNDVGDYLARSDLLVLASHFEGLPICILEAMRAGKPVIGSRVGGVSEAIDDGQTGLLVPPNDPQALAGAIRSMLDAWERRVEMGKQARMHFEQRFLAARCMPDLFALYRAPYHHAIH